jgi:hypothetical protein
MARTGHPFEGRLEIIIAVLLGVAAILGAYAALRNEQQNHDATTRFSEGIVNISNANQFYSSGNAIYSLDQVLFTEFAKDNFAGQGNLAQYFYKTLMRPELQRGIRWWQRSKTAKSPFDDKDPDYVVAEYIRAGQLDSATHAKFVTAKAAQNKADHYTLIEVILATALFLIGVAGVTRVWPIKITGVVLGALIILVSAVLLITA